MTGTRPSSGNSALSSRGTRRVAIGLADLHGHDLQVPEEMLFCPGHQPMIAFRSVPVLASVRYKAYSFALAVFPKAAVPANGHANRNCRNYLTG